MEPKKDTASIIDMLSLAGLNPTAQRIAVFQLIYNQMDHPTPEQVKTAVDKVFPRISLATIYNTLNVLVEKGLLRAVKLPSTGKVVFDANTAKHYHFIDEAKGTLYDIAPETVSLTLDLPDHFEVNDVDVFVKGSSHR